MMAAEAQPLLEVRELSTYFRTGNALLGAGGPIHKAVDGVSFTVPSGRTLGLVGESGCGKTTLSRTLLRLQPATSGEVLYRGRNILEFDRCELRRFRREVQCVQQDPLGSLSPRMTIGAALTEPLIVHRQGGRKQRRQRVAEVLSMVGIDPQDEKRYPHEFSGGQRQRICIARALILQPGLIICDEPVSALDLGTQLQILELLQQLQRDLALACLFISHNLGVVRRVCDRIAVMYAGRIVEEAPTDQLYRNPQHPYTRALLASIPSLKRRRVELRESQAGS